MVEKERSKTVIEGMRETVGVYPELPDILMPVPFEITKINLARQSGSKLGTFLNYLKDPNSTRDSLAEHFGYEDKKGLDAKNRSVIKLLESVITLFPRNNKSELAPIPPHTELTVAIWQAVAELTGRSHTILTTGIADNYLAVEKQDDETISWLVDYEINLIALALTDTDVRENLVGKLSQRLNYEDIQDEFEGMCKTAQQVLYTPMVNPYNMTAESRSWILDAIRNGDGVINIEEFNLTYRQVLERFYGLKVDNGNIISDKRWVGTEVAAFTGYKVTDGSARSMNQQLEQISAILRHRLDGRSPQEEKSYVVGQNVRSLQLYNLLKLRIDILWSELGQQIMGLPLGHRGRISAIGKKLIVLGYTQQIVSEFIAQNTATPELLDISQLAISNSPHTLSRQVMGVEANINELLIDNLEMAAQAILNGRIEMLLRRRELTRGICDELPGTDVYMKDSPVNEYIADKFDISKEKVSLVLKIMREEIEHDPEGEEILMKSEYYQNWRHTDDPYLAMKANRDIAERGLYEAYLSQYEDRATPYELLFLFYYLYKNAKGKVTDYFIEHAKELGVADDIPDLVKKGKIFENSYRVRMAIILNSDRDSARTSEIRTQSALVVLEKVREILKSEDVNLHDQFKAQYTGDNFDSDQVIRMLELVATGNSYQATAQKMGINPNAVYRRMRSIRTLQYFFSDKGLVRHHGRRSSSQD